MSKPQQPPPDPANDGSTLLELATWLTEFDVELRDLTSRVRFAKENEADVYHSTRAEALAAALNSVGSSVAELMSIMPVEADLRRNPEARLFCIGLIAQWLTDSSRATRSARVGIHGNTDSFPLPMVLEFLANQAKTGILKIMARTETFVLELCEGDIVHAASDNAPEGERLGEVLVELGHLAKTELTRVVSAKSRNRHRLGAELVDRHLVNEANLMHALETQVRRILVRLFAAEKSTFEFHEAATYRQPAKVRLSTMPLLLETATGQDRTAHDADLVAGTGTAASTDLVTGTDNTATDNTATDSTGTDNTATDSTATDSTGTDNTATDSTGTDNTGTDTGTPPEKGKAPPATEPRAAQPAHPAQPAGG